MLVHFSNFLTPRFETFLCTSIGQANFKETLTHPLLQMPKSFMDGHLGTFNMFHMAGLLVAFDAC